MPDPQNPQSLNRYAYTLNSPLNYSDPTGHCPHETVCVITGGETNGAKLARDPRGDLLGSVFLVPVYSAKPSTEPGRERTPAEIQSGKFYGTIAATSNIVASTISGSYASAQTGAYLFAGPTGPDDAIATMAYTPFDEIENWTSRVGAVATIMGEYYSGTTDLSREGLIIGQDTFVLAVTTYAGEYVGKVPVLGPYLDTVINLYVNYYDIGRLSGEIPIMLEGRIDENGTYILIYSNGNE